METALIGVPASRRARVLNRLTVPGAFATAVPRYIDDDADELAEAIASVQTGLRRFASDGVENQYHRNLGIDTYNVPYGPGLQGMDGEWTDVFKTFVGEVGKGIAGKISGKNPWQTSQTVVQPPPPPSTPGWVKFAAVGGAGALLIFLLANMRKG
jgi:hypothetical protein